MNTIRIKEAANLLGVSDDTVRRWIDHGSLTEFKDSAGRKVVDGAELARFASETATSPDDPNGRTSSARNRLVGLVTKVTVDAVMAEVEMQCGPFTVVSLMSAQSARSMDLQPGSVAVAVIKATTVIVENT